MTELIYTALNKDTVLLVGVISRNESEERVREYLDELEFLVETAGAVTRRRFTQKLDLPDSMPFLALSKNEEFDIESESDP